MLLILRCTFLGVGLSILHKSVSNESREGMEKRDEDTANCRKEKTAHVSMLKLMLLLGPAL